MSSFVQVFLNGILGSIFVGFAMLGNIVPVETKLTDFSPLEVAHMKNVAIVSYRDGLDEKRLTCGDVLTYNAPTNKITVRLSQDLNSYGSLIRSSTYTVIAD
jgi:hypothetical protein